MVTGLESCCHTLAFSELTPLVCDCVVEDVVTEQPEPCKEHLPLCKPHLCSSLYKHTLNTHYVVIWVNPRLNVCVMG